MTRTAADIALDSLRDADGVVPVESLPEAVTLLERDVKRLMQEGGNLEGGEMLMLVENHQMNALMFIASFVLEIRDELDGMWNFMQRHVAGVKKSDLPKREQTSEQELANIHYAIRLDKLRSLYNYLYAKMGRVPGSKLIVAKSFKEGRQ